MTVAQHWRKFRNQSRRILKYAGWERRWLGTNDVFLHKKCPGKVITVNDDHVQIENRGEFEPALYTLEEVREYFIQSEDGPIDKEKETMPQESILNIRCGLCQACRNVKECQDKMMKVLALSVQRYFNERLGAQPIGEDVRLIWNRTLEENPCEDSLDQYNLEYCAFPKDTISKWILIDTTKARDWAAALARFEALHPHLMHGVWNSGHIAVTRDGNMRHTK